MEIFFGFFGSTVGNILITLLIIEVLLFLFILKILFRQRKEIKIYESNSIYNILSFICLIIVVLSLIINFGWLRIIVFITGVPLIMLIIHYIMFFVINNYYSHFENYSKKLDIVNKLVYATYFMTWVFFPDCGDDGSPARMFLGIIKFYSETILQIFLFLSVILLFFNFMLLIIQFIGTVRIKKKIQEQQEE